ncbi:MAG: hypothetical protein LBE59_07075 [Nevskiaceae bacterium]|jgi:hypothetical protein|nr:hypothetical protein [Nevskiaceae bacterium]
MTYRRTIPGVLAALMVMAPLGAALAHHSFAAQYDGRKTVTIEGAVTKVEWMNPHGYFFVDVVDPATGNVTSWSCEIAAPAALMRSGWTRNSLKPGDLVVVEGALARDGANALNAGNVTLAASGKKLFGRAANEEREAKQARESAN